MAAPWSLWTNPVSTSLLGSLWLPPGGPLWDSFFGSILEAVSGLNFEMIWSVQSIPESSRKAIAVDNEDDDDHDDDDDNAEEVYSRYSVGTDEALQLGARPLQGANNVK